MERHTTWVALGLGSNIEDRMAFLEDAAFRLQRFLSHHVYSSVYETAPLLPESAPPEWNKPYLNMAMGGETTLSPDELLQEVKALELKLGRKDRGRWGPREIDIDILTYGDEVVENAALHIPHIGLSSRAFALVPLSEIAPDWNFPNGPNQGKTTKALVDALGYDKKLNRFHA